LAAAASGTSSLGSTPHPGRAARCRTAGGARRPTGRRHSTCRSHAPGGGGPTAGSGSPLTRRAAGPRAPAARHPAARAGDAAGRRDSAGAAGAARRRAGAATPGACRRSATGAASARRAASGPRRATCRLRGPTAAAVLWPIAARRAHAAAAVGAAGDWRGVARHPGSARPARAGAGASPVLARYAARRAGVLAARVRRAHAHPGRRTLARIANVPRGAGLRPRHRAAGVLKARSVVARDEDPDQADRQRKDGTPSRSHCPRRPLDGGRGAATRDCQNLLSHPTPFGLTMAWLSERSEDPGSRRLARSNPSPVARVTPPAA